jgi:hypothetical protein
MADDDVNGPKDREGTDPEILDPIEPVDDGTHGGDQPPAGFSNQAVRMFVLGVSIATIAVIALVVTRDRGSCHRSAVAPSSASTSTAEASPLRSFGTLNTRFGPAVMVCGEEAMPACGTGTHLEFVSCSHDLIGFFHGYYEDAADARTAAFVGRPPPSGNRWSWGCGRDFRPTTTDTGGRHVSHSTLRNHRSA